LPWDECPWTRTAKSPFRCPRCGAVSYNPHDKAEGYCGRCHAFVDDDPVSAAFVCAACGALQDHNTIRCEKCGKPLVFLREAVACPLVVDGQRHVTRIEPLRVHTKMDPRIKLVD
jgi:predicted RNA-binding Zn-ribbon protein involved in translation (DUF1610 family)